MYGLSYVRAFISANAGFIEVFNNMNIILVKVVYGLEPLLRRDHRYSTKDFYWNLFFFPSS